MTKNNYEVRFYNVDNMTVRASVGLVATNDINAKRQLKGIAREVQSTNSPGKLTKYISGQGYVTIAEFDNIDNLTVV